MKLCAMKKLQLKKVLLVKGGGKSSRMSFFRGVKVRVDEKWTWGEGGQKRPKMGGRPLYTVPLVDEQATNTLYIVQVKTDTILLECIL